MDVFHQDIQSRQPLCARCDRLGLSELVHPTGWECLSHGQGSPEVQARFTTPPPHYLFIRESIEVQANAAICRFCKLLWAVLRTANGNTEPPVEHDGQPTMVRLKAELFAQTRPGGPHARVDAYYDIPRLCVAICPRREGLPLADRVNNAFPDALVTSFFCFQTCDAKHPNVTELCDRNGEQLRNNMLHYSGRMRPWEVDFRLLKWWNRECSWRHQDICPSLESYRTPLDMGTIRFINMVEWCIVTKDSSAEGIQFAALSYVWGPPGTEPLKLEQGSIKLFNPGILSALKLPKTIEDAVVLTRQLGLTYLWVDSLCIIQDDDDDKAKFIPNMDKIYGGAFVTIVAAAGEDVYAGLPGMRPDTRTAQQERVFMRRRVEIPSSKASSSNSGTESGSGPQTSRLVRDLLLMTTLRPQRLELDHYLQEEQVYWECQGGSFCEESHFDFWIPRITRFSKEPSLHPSEQVTAGTPSETTDMLPGTLQPTALASYEEWSRHYYRLVLKYTRRNLTQQKDYLHALRGALNELTNSWGEEFFWGFPRSSFEQHLMWSGANRGIREAIHEEKDWTGNNFACRFPTWSWLAWMGYAWVPVSNGVTSRLVQIMDQPNSEGRIAYSMHRPEIVCYAVDMEASVRYHDGAIQVKRVCDIRKQAPDWHQSLAAARPDLQPNAWREATDLSVRMADVVAVVPAWQWGLMSNSLEMAVFFWASSAGFKVSFAQAMPSNEWLFALDNQTVVGRHMKPAILNDEGEVVGHLNQMFKYHYDDLGFEQGKQEFVVVGSFEEEAEETGKAPTKWLDVILLVYRRDRFARRASVGQIRKDEWIRVEREWKLVVLG